MIPAWLGPAAAFLLGSIVGSFLNACIYRLPRGLSVSKPVRSFCPSCKHPIRWYHNIPILSYLLLRGKCADCGAEISPRYPFVEFLTALIFLALWQMHGMPDAAVYWVLASLLIAATFIDLDFLIIPDEITLGGIAAGLIFSVLVPGTWGQDSRIIAFAYSLLGAAAGWFLLWSVVELGKLAFGKKRIALQKAEQFTWRRHGETADIELESGKITWEETFSRPTDILHINCTKLDIAGEHMENVHIRFRYDFLYLPDGRTFDLDRLDEIRGEVTSITIPREAMGFGDVKFLAAIGAFLGWEAVLFTLFVSSIVGSLAGVGGILLARRGHASGQIPFGPFLAFGAAVWMLGGSALWSWYFLLFRSGFSPL